MARVRELTELRTAHAKHFLRDDGQYEAEIYLGPVHYHDGIAWADIDLSAGPDASVPGFSHAVTRAPYALRFARTSKNPVRFEFSPGKHVTYRAQGGAAAQATITGNVALYPDAWMQTDLRLTATPTGVKEDIILKGVTAPASFAFAVDLAGLTARLADGGLEYLDGEQVIGRIPAPWAEDAAGVRGPVTLAYDGSTVTLAVDPAWLADPARVFPVLVDPTTTLQPGAEGKDSFIWGPSGNPTANWGNSDSLYHGYQTDYYRIIIQFDLSSIPAGSTIQAGTLSLYHVGWGGSASGSQTSNVHRVTNPWTEGYVSWNNRDNGIAWATAGSDFDGTAAASLTFNNSGTGVWRDWTITALVQQWFDNTYPNYGVILKQQSYVDGYWYSPSSDNTGAPSQRPKLVVTYNAAPTAPTGLTPGGPSGSPTVVANTTPTLSWTHNDPDSDPQSAFQVIIIRNSDSVQVHDSGQVNSGTSSYTVPGGVLSEGVVYRWKVRTKDASAWGPYATEVYIKTNTPPPTPTLTAEPDQHIHDLGAGTVRLEWGAVTDPDGDAVTYEIRIGTTDGGSEIGSAVGLTTLYYDKTGGWPTYGSTIYWSVRAKDANNGYSSWATSDSFVNTNSGPSATLTNASGASAAAATSVYDDLTPRLTWTFSDPEGEAQASYQVQAYRENGSLIVDTGEVASANAYYDLPSSLAYGDKVKWRVKVKDAHGVWSSYTADGWGKVDLSAPTDLNAAADAANAEIDLAWTAHAGENLAGYNVYRKPQGAADGQYKKINTALVGTNSYTDDAVGRGVAYDYAVTAAATNSYESAKSTAALNASVTWTAGDWWLGDLKLPGVDNWEAEDPFKVSEQEVLGKSVPVHQKVGPDGGRTGARITLALDEVAETDYQSLLTELAKADPLSLRDPLGRIWRVKVSRPGPRRAQIVPSPTAKYRVVIPLREVVR